MSSKSSNDHLSTEGKKFHHSLKEQALIDHSFVLVQVAQLKSRSRKINTLKVPAEDLKFFEIAQAKLLGLQKKQRELSKQNREYIEESIRKAKEKRKKKQMSKKRLNQHITTTMDNSKADPQKAVNMSNESRCTSSNTCVSPSPSRSREGITTDDGVKKSGKLNQWRAPRTRVHKKTKTLTRFQRNYKFEFGGDSEDPNPNRFILHAEDKSNQILHQNSGQKYQIFYKGFPIDDDEKDRLFAKFITKNGKNYECLMHSNKCHTGSGICNTLKNVKNHLSKYSLYLGASSAVRDTERILTCSPILIPMGINPRMHSGIPE